ncbi:MAG: tetratricopeptide repeat protein [Chloroflexi bacterium]|nr:tetratricopeptide repeat protein [Chloroflexota bacterium]
MALLMPRWLADLIDRYRQRNLSAPEKTLTSYDKGVRATAQGNHALAIRHFTRALASTSDSNKLYHHRADAFASNGQHLEAIVDYDVAVRLEPAYPDTYLDRGNSRYALGKLDDAIKDFSEAIRLKPDWAEAYANRAVAHAERGDAAESEEDSARARLLGVDEARLTEMLNDAARTNADQD